jgi:hypothetical protein
LNYCVRFTPSTGSTAPFDGSTLYELSGFSLGDTQSYNVGLNGLIAGKVAFGAASLSFNGASITPVRQATAFLSTMVPRPSAPIRRILPPAIAGAA